MRIVVVGAGYVGLSLAVLLAQRNEVICVDKSKSKIDAINNKKSPIKDDDISRFLLRSDLRLFGTENLKSAVKNAEFVILATPTNFNDEANSFDTLTIETLVANILRFEPEICIVIKSTVPVGFIEKLRARHETTNIMFSPEFLREGKALHDNLFPSRIIIGDDSLNAKRFADLLVQASQKKDVSCLLTNAREAEAIKLFANTFLAMRIAFFNEAAYSIPEIIWTVDDVWLSGMAYSNGVKVWAHDMPRPVYSDGYYDKLASLRNFTHAKYNRESADRYAVDYLRSVYNVWP
jgi:UDPglucose 6-dehydrogenase